MLKFFDSNHSCHIILELPITSDDYDMLKSLFTKEYSSWHLEFGRVYSIKTDMLNLLYKEIYDNSKHISITTHKNKLNSYLYRRGFKTTFKSLIKQDVLDIENIELVLIGGSADSSSKIIEIVKNVRLHNLALVVVQHVQVDKNGIFDELLQNYTNYKVSYAKDGMKIQKGFIYLAPNNKHLKVKEGFFYLSDDENYNYSKPSISLSYESFSSYYKEKLLVIQECGYASDGVDKLELVKQNSSKLIIQQIEECEAKPMVSNALFLKVHDYVLSLEDIIIYINLLDKRVTKEGWIDYLLEMIYKKYDYDFKLYYRDMVNRRVDIFMAKHDIKSIKNAVGVILFNRSAFKGFFLEVSINVTELFREPKTLKRSADILKKHYKNTYNIKVWSAGCSSGEETYSIAIILDCLGLLEKSIIYATDFNSVVIEEAKNGTYSNKSYEAAQNNFNKIGLETDLDKYLIKNNNYIEIDERIKDKAMFFQHNLIEDSSFNEFDIIICKNVIIYFDKELQNRFFQLFYDSLKFGGYLVLGESETIARVFCDKFKQSEDNCNIFKKVN
ncbi:MAG: CheR family methyltransferase [Campylobacterota bacterium]|nr:CheR family methyltransferase [Campylobacterota bacterium]